MYNTPIEFHGDIIITDPCYIVKENEDRFDDMPCWWDFVSKQTVEVKDGTTYHHYPKPTDYPDCKVVYKNSFGFTDQEAKELIASGVISKDFFYKDDSETLNKEMEAYNKALDKWRKENESDWEKCECGENMEVLGFTNFLCDDTIYGDWSCHVKDTDTDEVLGTFCADASMVGVFLMDEILKYNPDYKPDSCACVIKDFHGTVELRNEDDEVTVIGVGNVNFRGYQTGL